MSIAQQLSEARQKIKDLEAEIAFKSKALADTKELAALLEKNLPPEPAAAPDSDK